MYARMRKTTLLIDGMHCGSCVAAVTSALHRLPSLHVERAVVGEVTVVHDPAATSRSAMVAAVARAGYRVLEEGRSAGRAVGGCCGSHRPHALERASRIATHRR